MTDFWILHLLISAFKIFTVEHFQNHECLHLHFLRNNLRELCIRSTLALHTSMFCFENKIRIRRFHSHECLHLHLLRNNLRGLFIRSTLTLHTGMFCFENKIGISRFTGRVFFLPTCAKTLTELFWTHFVRRPSVFRLYFYPSVSPFVCKLFTIFPSII